MAADRRGPEGLLPLEIEVPAGAYDTRWHRALRRQSANRARRLLGKDALQAVEAGKCGKCRGWGVVGAARIPCDHCGGSGG